MIAEILSAVGLAGGAAAGVLGWRAAANAQARATSEVEARRAAGEAYADTIRQLTAELGIVRTEAGSSLARLERALADTVAVRADLMDRDHRIEELYAVVEKYGLPGGADRVRDLMRAAASDPAVPGPGRDPNAR